MEISQKIKKESIYIIVTFIIALILLKILFLEEPFITTLKVVLSLFWLFTLPGFYLMYYWHEKLDFLERLIIGTALGAAIMVSIGYNISLVGIKTRIRAIVIPVICFIISAILIKHKAKNKAN